MPPVRRPRVEEAIVGAGLVLIAIALFAPWWSRPSNEGVTTPLTWQSPATNINLLLFPAAGLALLLLVLGVAFPSRSRWRRALWALPLMFAGFGFIVAGIELAYLEVFDDARLGMPLGFLGLAVLWLGCIVSVVRSTPFSEPRRL